MIDACTRCGKCVDQNYLKGAAPQATLELRVTGGLDAQAVDHPKDAIALE
jgi:hypothetical protein